ncbi:ankyrin repeat protein, putative [Trichomonas vaginalis G3]|uniref:Ankyrin repeat protein, putative n=1 Tax=Trichomonas vaginalis (strain ATCC PRA-98 / G3) TaxID=412133 RepID=A2DXB6_TRIV3|nr:ankyrin repeat protein family [Trichomonas vaginalis G3]EAY14998.1 ankyrin repeat protein, putative [Trichomonas vaginalis G3]KAI5507322.1 ankyrin repeat protein family [Trichomonas vaginalis G3]|eukprot:XP_001327221.1 ankyrin repeat protein [Trichomonas vaginalis G3]
MKISKLTTNDFVNLLKQSHHTIKAKKLSSIIRDSNVSIDDMEDIISTLKSVKKYMKFKIFNGIIDFLEHQQQDTPDPPTIMHNKDTPDPSKNIQNQKSDKQAKEKGGLFKRLFHGKDKQAKEEKAKSKSDHQKKEEKNKHSKEETNAKDQIDNDILAKIAELKNSDDFDSIYYFFNDLSKQDKQAAISKSCAEGLWNARNEDDGGNVLHVACEDGNFKLVKYLIESGCDKESKSNNGNTPLIVASSEGHLQIIEYLISAGCDKEAKHNTRNTPLTMASRRDKLQIVDYLISVGCNLEGRDDEGNTPLILASRNGHLEVVQFLIEAGANKDAKNFKYQTSIDCASQEDHPEIVKYLSSCECDSIIRDPIRAKIYKLKDSNNFEQIYNFMKMLSLQDNHNMFSLACKEGLCEKRNASWMDVLHVASKEGNIQLVKSLLKCRCYIENIDQNGNTPLIISSLFDKQEVVKYLISAGADKEAKNKDGNTPLSIATKEGHLEVVKYLISVGANKEVKDKDGNTLLIIATKGGRLEVVKYLISIGADKEVKDKDGNTPLIEASILDKLGIVKYLISIGADKEAKNNDGDTPLSIAAKEGHIEIGKYLLSIGANKEGKSIEFLLDQIDKETLSKLMKSDNLDDLYNFLDQLSSSGRFSKAFDPLFCQRIDNSS